MLELLKPTFRRRMQPQLIPTAEMRDGVTGKPARLWRHGVAVAAARSGSPSGQRTSSGTDAAAGDYAIQTPTGIVDIEVDGSQHADQRGRQRRQDLARDAVLQATGLRVIRVPAWRCPHDPDTTAREIAGRP